MTAKAVYPFAGSNILITGGEGDIGKATAMQLAADGAGIDLLNSNEPKMSEVVQALKSHNVPVGAFCCDVTSPGDVAKAFAAATAQFGWIDCVFKMGSN